MLLYEQSTTYVIMDTLHPLFSLENTHSHPLKTFQVESKIYIQNYDHNLIVQPIM